MQFFVCTFIVFSVWPWTSRGFEVIYTHYWNMYLNVTYPDYQIILQFWLIISLFSKISSSETRAETLVNQQLKVLKYCDMHPLITDKWKAKSHSSTSRRSFGTEAMKPLHPLPLPCKSSTVSHIVIFELFGTNSVTKPSETLKKFRKMIPNMPLQNFIFFFLIWKNDPEYAAKNDDFSSVWKVV